VINYNSGHGAYLILDLILGNTFDYSQDARRAH